MEALLMEEIVEIEEEQAFNVYKDIANRTNGEIYIGVVGPVRTGKSTFIKRFMDLLVLPHMEDGYDKERTIDEQPQSAAGKSIMTTEPKFVPNEAVDVVLGEQIHASIRLIDCVGYLIPGVNGHLEEGEPRMVNTPWFEEQIPFEEAAELGTQKVIKEHATIGIVVTTDGTISGISRENYVDAERRVVEELQAINKPFIMLLNTTAPYGREAESLSESLSESYGVPVIPLNIAQMKVEDIHSMMERILQEFPLRELCIELPKWIETLHNDHWIKASIIDTVKGMMGHVVKLRHAKTAIPLIEENEFIKKAYIEHIQMGEGVATLVANVLDNLFYKVLSETTGMDITGEFQLISTMQVLAEAKKEYDKVKSALEQVQHKGYGVVMPAMEETILDDPVLVKHGSRYGVKINAKAPSIHMIRCDIETEISPIVGTEAQSRDLIEYLEVEMQENPDNMWELNMFGKSMEEMVRDGLQSKLHQLPEDTQVKLQETLQKMVNDGKGRFICIMF